MGGEGGRGYCQRERGVRRMKRRVWKRGLCYEREFQPRITVCCRKVFCLEHVTDVSSSPFQKLNSSRLQFVSVIDFLHPSFTDPPITLSFFLLLVAPLPLVFPTMSLLQIDLHIHISPLNICLATLSSIADHRQRG